MCDCCSCQGHLPSRHENYLLESFLFIFGGFLLRINSLRFRHTLQIRHTDCLACCCNQHRQSRHNHKRLQYKNGVSWHTGQRSIAVPNCQKIDEGEVDCSKISPSKSSFAEVKLGCTKEPKKQRE